MNIFKTLILSTIIFDIIFRKFEEEPKSILSFLKSYLFFLQTVEEKKKFQIYYEKLINQRITRKNSNLINQNNMKLHLFCLKIKVIVKITKKIFKYFV